MAECPSMVGNGRRRTCRRFFGHLTLEGGGLRTLPRALPLSNFLFCPSPRVRRTERASLPKHTRPCPSPTLRIGLSGSAILYRYRSKFILVWFAHPRMWGSMSPWRARGTDRASGGPVLAELRLARLSRCLT